MFLHAVSYSAGNIKAYAERMRAMKMKADRLMVVITGRSVLIAYGKFLVAAIDDRQVRTLEGEIRKFGGTKNRNFVFTAARWETFGKHSLNFSDKKPGIWLVHAHVAGGFRKMLEKAGMQDRSHNQLFTVWFRAKKERPLVVVTRETSALIVGTDRDKVCDLAAALNIDLMPEKLSCPVRVAPEIMRRQARVMDPLLS